MSSGDAKPHGEMLKLALEVVGLIGWACERVAIAGSLRRGKALVGDIEIVAAPRYRPVWNGAWNDLDAWCETLMKRGTVQKRLNAKGHTIAWGGWTEAELRGDDDPPAGSRYKAMLYRGVPVDLFIVLRDRQFGPTLLIRTGPNEANQALVTTDGVTNSSGIRGVLPSGLRFEDGAVWRGAQKLDTPTEASVFAACGLPVVPPHLRTAALYQELARRRGMRQAMAAAGWTPRGVAWGWREMPWTTNVPREVERATPVQAALFEMPARRQEGLWRGGY